MFGIADLITVVVIQDGLNHLAKNPEHLEFVLGMYRRCPVLQDLVGPEHIKQSVDYVTQNRIVVAPYYELDRKRRPCISVVDSGVEDQQFIGDEGSFQESSIVMKPFTYSRFNAKGIDANDKKLLVVPESYNLQDKLWKGLYIVNGDFSSRLDGIKVNGSDAVLYLTDEVPDSVPLKGFEAQSSDQRKGFHILASMNKVTVQCKLTTTGDFVIHRLLSIVLRYCLKSRRMLFDSYGMQTATFSYTPPIMTDPDEKEYETVHTVEAKFTEQWIEKEVDLTDDAANIITEIVVNKEDDDPFVAS